MKAILTMEDPGNIEATMKITMTLEAWTNLRDQLQDKWPSSDLSCTINDLIMQSRKVFYPEPGE